MLQQDETKTEEPRTGNFKQLTEEFERRDKEIRDLKQRMDEFERRDEEMKGLTERMEFVEGRSNDVSDKYQRLEEGDKNKQKHIRELMEIKELNKKLVERVCVVEGRSSDKFNFAKLPPFPRINTDGINTDGINTDGINTDVRKTLEDIVERCKYWDREIEVWVRNTDDCLDKLVEWWEGEQYKDVDEFKRDVKEWRDLLYKYLFSEVELYDSLIKWIQFVCSQPDCLYDGLPDGLPASLFVSLGGSLYVSLYVSFLWKSKDDLYRKIDDYKRLQDEVKVEIEPCINRLDQIISDEGKDNTGRSEDNKFYIRFSGYIVDLTSAQTNFVRIYKHLKL